MANPPNPTAGLAQGRQRMSNLRAMVEDLVYNHPNPKTKDFADTLEMLTLARAVEIALEYAENRASRPQVSAAQAQANKLRLASRELRALGFEGAAQAADRRAETWEVAISAPRVAPGDSAL